jgi:hypothetical protein
MGLSCKIRSINKKNEKLSSLDHLIYFFHAIKSHSIYHQFFFTSPIIQNLIKMLFFQLKSKLIGNEPDLSHLSAKKN